MDVYSFGVNPVTTHAWNKSRQQLAFTPNNQEVHLYQYEKGTNDWAQLDVLAIHDLKVTGIDWAPNTNRIVTCSADRNAYVWTQNDDKKWKPTLALLRQNRAATCVKWSPQENKFAAGSGARLISVCYFESENDWWVAKHVKKPIKSTITCLDWHPNNYLLACGSTDFKVRVFSAYIKDIESAPQPTNWGPKNTFGNCLVELNNSSNGGGWLHSVAFSKDGNKLCWTSHDASINVADVSQGSPASIYKLKTDSLPFLTCIWLSNTYIVAAGHSCCPILYEIIDNQIKYIEKLDSSQKKEAMGLSAMKKFQSLDRQNRVEINDTALDTVHQNAITSMRMYAENNNNVTKLSTSGLDGRLVLWDLNTLEKSVEGLKIS